METPDLDNALIAFKTNTLGPWRVSAAFLPMLKKSKQPRIVNVSSGSGSLTNMKGDTPVYSMSKAALNVLTIKMALSWRKYGVKVNAVCPGWVRTELGGKNAPRSPEEGASCILWAANIPDDGPTGGFFRDGNAISW
jgi:NAD(P)-dependent dehydrogenase (short-subunit alcohol dehydrogenase family)